MNRLLQRGSEKSMPFTRHKHSSNYQTYRHKHSFSYAKPKEYHRGRMSKSNSNHALPKTNTNTLDMKVTRFHFYKQPN